MICGDVLFWDRLPRRDYHGDHPNVDAIFVDSISTALTFAQYLGSKKVYLIGFDYLHNPPKTYRWYETAASETSRDIFLVWRSKFFDVMKKYIDIVTFTLTPQATKLPSTDYQMLTGQALTHPENPEILTREITKL